MTSKTDVSKIPRQGQRREDYSLTRPLDGSVASTRSTRTRQPQHPAPTNTPTNSIYPTPATHQPTQKFHMPPTPTLRRSRVDRPRSRNNISHPHHNTMSTPPPTLPTRLAEIKEDFLALSAADRLQYLLEFSQNLPPLPEQYTDHPDLLERVEECQSPVF